MVQIESRALTSEEERRLIEEASPAAARGEIGCLGAWLLLLVVVAGLAAGNVAVALRLPERPLQLAAFAAALAAVGLWLRLGPIEHARCAWPGFIQRKLAAGPVECWSFEPSRGWSVACPQTRALLLEASDGRLVLVASRHLEDLPPDTFPEHIELEVLPQLDRVLSLTASGRPRATEPGALTLGEIESDQPLKKRRFVELAPECLDESLTARLGMRRASPRSQDTDPAAGRATHCQPVGPWDDSRLRPRQLVPERVRRWASILTWSVPVLAVFVFVGYTRLPGAARSRGGAGASLLAVLLAAAYAALLLADSLRMRAVRRLLSGDVRAAPNAWRRLGRLVHVRGRVRALGAFASILSGRPAVLARLRGLPGGWDLFQGEDFVLESDAGPPLRVDASRAWLVHAEDRETVGRIDNHTLARLPRPADVSDTSRRRFHFPFEQLVRDGDVVYVLGLVADDAVVRASGPWPVLVWFPGMALDDLVF